MTEARRRGGWFELARWFVAAAAAFGIWAVILNREIIDWQPSEAKRLTIVALALALAALGAVPLWLRWRGPWTRACVLVVLVLFGGELRRAWLRYSYATGQAGIPPIALLRPITTTELELVHLDSRLPGLAVPRLRVVHLTDVHITEALPREYYARVSRELAARDPDLLLLTGDYLSQLSRLPLLAGWLASLPHARYGNFAVLGNHDLWLDAGKIRALLADHGVTTLSGTCRSVTLASGGVRLCGTEAPWGPRLERAAIAQDAAEKLPLVVMTHTPDNIYALHELGAAAVFAGHTHGGQMRLPVFGSILVPSVYGRRFDVGHFNIDGTELYVSAGVGADEPPLRIYCPPELAEVDFHP